MLWAGLSKSTSCLLGVLLLTVLIQKGHGFLVLSPRHATGTTTSTSTALDGSLHEHEHKNGHDEQDDELDVTMTTNITLTLPRFLEGKVEDGFDYPSPLHHIHVRSILSDAEVARCWQLAESYAQQTGCWESPDQERHATYSTCDFPIQDNRDLSDYLTSIQLDDRIWKILAECYGIQETDMTYLDFFCAHYQAQQPNDKHDTSTQQTTMDRLEPHRDGSLLSFTVLLNDPSNFAGGGTFFDALRDVVPDTTHPQQQVLYQGGVVRPTRAGDGTFHSGKILHGADVVTAGSRTVLVGFVDVAEWAQRPGALALACRDWGRMDVATFRYERQRSKSKNGWYLNHQRWCPPKSCLKGFVPAFSSVERRADPEFQRQQKLQAEDVLLRTILMTGNEAEEEEQHHGFDLLEGDITVL
ncbi:P4Hc [Seminavis robusta]|uniref:P4Hc n=1 Tax=Seminavis robusta TaxID=568900 RepID=A0A9N8EX90_9STRA|nr:P4Hc [Seminavis robusta]|eukprot:Sro1875_g303050.1 P4Hc (413) ;mRNA; f:16986-18224